MEKVHLDKLTTKAPEDISRENIEKRLEEIRAEIIEIQKKFHADGRKGILVILQWMDASWKDSTIRKVFSWINPLWVHAVSFGKPTSDEFKHDFLWRIHKEIPKKWMITIFNRSHYEDILVPSVEGYIDKKTIENRYEHINAFEKMLADEGVIILKFFLHMSKEVQKKRLEERITIERKFWKFDPSDTAARKKWDDYMEVYEEIFEKTDTKWAPWHIIPTDDKWYKAYLVADAILESLKSLDLVWPKLWNESILLDDYKLVEIIDK